MYCLLHWRMIDTCLHQLLLLHLLAITLLLCLNGMCNDRWVTVKDECWTDLKQKDEGWLPFTAENWNGHIFWYGWNNIFEWNFTSTMEQGYHPCGTMDLYVCFAHKKIEEDAKETTYLLVIDASQRHKGVWEKTWRKKKWRIADPLSCSLGQEEEEKRKENTNGLRRIIHSTLTRHV